jgi:hypothetical protein
MDCGVKANGTKFAKDGFKVNRINFDTYGKGKPILHTGSDFAHPSLIVFEFNGVNNPSMSQEGVFASHPLYGFP